MDTSLFKTHPKVLYFWEGFPPCALLLVSIKKELGDNLTILGTRAKVNFPDFEILYPELNIIWLDNPNQIWDLKDSYTGYQIIIHTGWGHHGWMKYSKWMKHKENSKLFFTVDNFYNGSLRQYLGALYFRFNLKNLYNGAFVPGQASLNYLRFLGMPISKIFCGYYGAFEDIYFSKIPINERYEEFLFVGQLEHRKGLDYLLKAFKLYRANGGQWNLRISGSGQLEKNCSGEGVIFDKFLNPYECALKMRNSRCLILPSRDEHWGTVVCEAAASGMLLLLSTNIGSSQDILRNGINGYSFETSSVIDLFEKMELISNWNCSRSIIGSDVSVAISKAYNSKSFLNGFLSMIGA